MTESQCDSIIIQKHSKNIPAMAVVIIDIFTLVNAYYETTEFANKPKIKEQNVTANE